MSTKFIILMSLVKTGQLSIILCFYNIVNGFIFKPDSYRFLWSMSTFRFIGRKKIKDIYWRQLVNVISIESNSNFISFPKQVKYQERTA